MIKSLLFYFEAARHKYILYLKSMFCYSIALIVVLQLLLVQPNPMLQEL